MKKRCPTCDLPMFGYALMHNGKLTKIWRCMSAHGTKTPSGNVKQIAGRKIARGVRKIFAPLFTTALDRAH